MVDVASLALMDPAPAAAEVDSAPFRTLNRNRVRQFAPHTPAMRLGFTREPLNYKDILWPGERVPRPKRARHNGRGIAIPGALTNRKSGRRRSH